MNFVMDKDMPATIRTDVVLSDRATGKLFNDKFRQIFIELPNFNKEEDECNTDFERWIYILKHMDTLDRMPFKARKAVFERLEKLASKANMTQEERMQYEEEWKVYNDYFNTLDFAEQKGMQKGIRETARKLKELGVADDIIIKIYGYFERRNREIIIFLLLLINDSCIQTLTSFLFILISILIQ